MARSEVSRGDIWIVDLGMAQKPRPAVFGRRALRWSIKPAERKARENAAKPSKKISVGNEAKTAPKKAENGRARRKVKPRNPKSGT